jgi:hypothetical protein
MRCEVTDCDRCKASEYRERVDRDRPTRSGTMLTEHPALMFRRITGLNIPPYQRPPGKRAARCFQGKTFSIAFAHFVGHRVGFEFRRPQSQHGLTAKQQDGLQGFPTLCSRRRV